MKPEKQKYHSQLLKYCLYSGIEIQKNRQMRCPNAAAHNNNDAVFSAHLYERSKNGKPQIKCFSCGWTGDIYDLCGILNNTNDFLEQYKIIDRLFGSGEFLLSQEQEKFVKSGNKGGGEIKPARPVAVPREHARKVFSRENIDNCRKHSKFDIIRDGEICGIWFYDDFRGRIIAIDVRFELGYGRKRRKIVQTFWYDGRRLCSWGELNIIYNLYNALTAESEKIKIIHEGAKCAQIGKKYLKNFCNIAYNRGVENADKPDWSVISGSAGSVSKEKPVVILPDNDSPGMKGALKIWNKFEHVIIPSGIYNHFGIGHIKGADIEDLIIAGVEAEEIEGYIYRFLK